MNKLSWMQLTLALLLAGCATLKPVDLPDETASPPAENPLWAELDAAQPDDWFLLLNDGTTALDWRLRLIDSASSSLDLQTFLWKEDQTGLHLFRQILGAADRGVRIRLLLDDSFTVGENDLIYDFAQHPNIEFRIYNPFRHRPDSMALRQLLNLGEFSRIDHRMHNKTMIIDNRAVILGGGAIWPMNISASMKPEISAIWNCCAQAPWLIKSANSSMRSGTITGRSLPSRC